MKDYDFWVIFISGLIGIGVLFLIILMSYFIILLAVLLSNHFSLMSIFIGSIALSFIVGSSIPLIKNYIKSNGRGWLDE